jgi:uncharacterized SAM-binding protein YcdF (DUF218 family)
MRRLVRAGLTLWAAGLVAVCLWTLLWPMDRPLPRGDAILCLGAGIGEDGVIDASSRLRAEACAALARAGAAPVIVFSGGSRGPGHPSVAARMADAARAAGIGTARVLLEEASQSTLQNLLFSRPLLPEGGRVILVTEAFHLPRSWASARAMGLGDVALHPSGRLHPSDDAIPGWPLLRESLALWFNAARYAAWRVGGALGLAEDARVGWLH